MNVCILGCISKEKKETDALHDIKLSLNLFSGALFLNVMRSVTISKTDQLRCWDDVLLKIT